MRITESLNPRFGRFWPFWAPGPARPGRASERPSEGQYGERLGFWPISGQKWPKRGPKMAQNGLFWAIFRGVLARTTGSEGPLGASPGTPIWQACQIKVTGLGDLAQEVAIMAQIVPKRGHFGTPFWALFDHFWAKSPSPVTIRLEGPPRRGPKYDPKWPILGPLFEPLWPAYGPNPQAP